MFRKQFKRQRAVGRNIVNLLWLNENINERGHDGFDTGVGIGIFREKNLYPAAVIDFVRPGLYSTGWWLYKMSFFFRKTKNKIKFAVHFGRDPIY